jgi:hypothetical protein
MLLSTGLLFLHTISKSFCVKLKRKSNTKCERTGNLRVEYIRESQAKEDEASKFKIVEEEKPNAQFGTHVNHELACYMLTEFRCALMLVSVEATNF